MKQYRLCFLGFGNVGRALARLFVAKSTELRDSYGIDWTITGVATRRMGWRVNQNGFDTQNLLSTTATDFETANTIEDWLKAAAPDVVFETTSLNPENGQPAIDYLKSLSQRGSPTRLLPTKLRLFTPTTNSTHLLFNRANVFFRVDSPR
jgi:homoserine dehydrogenase